MIMTKDTIGKLVQWAETYNDRENFKEDPIIFPRHFADRLHSGQACLQDVEIAAIFASHFAWGRRSLIVRDLQRLMDFMQWKPYDYVMKGQWKDDPTSVHRTIKWSETAAICSRLKAIYEQTSTLEGYDQEAFRTGVFGQKPDAKSPNKKINMMRRWMVRDDGKVDLGVWKNSDKDSLLIPLDVHVHDVATILGLTERKQKDINTVKEITDSFRDIFPGDPCKGDFALFGYGVTHPKESKPENADA